jgi:hypothetical protein
VSTSAHTISRSGVHRPPRRLSPIKPPPPSSAGGPLITGQLIADVTPLAPGASPLVHSVAAPTSAPPARQATRTSRLPALAAALVVALLLALGAGRELRGRRDWRTLLPSS